MRSRRISGIEVSGTTGPVAAVTGMGVSAATLKLAQAGDHQAFAEIVEQTSPKVFALCLRLSGNEHDALDIMQDTYLRVFRSLDSFRGDSSLSTWIYRIAANCASTQLSKRQRRSERALDVDVDILGNLPEKAHDRDPELVSESGDDRRRLIAALGSLPFSLRSVVVLYDVYDLSHEEIATELGISRAAVKVRLHRARKKLHELLFAAESLTSTGPDIGSSSTSTSRKGSLYPISRAKRPNGGREGGATHRGERSA